MSVGQLLSAGEIGTFRGGSGFPTRFQGQKSGELPFFKVSDMSNPGNELFMRHANNYISESQRKTIGAVRIPSGAIVFAKVGAAIFLERKRILAQDSCIDNNMAAFIVVDDQVDIRFAHHLLTDFRMSSLVATTALPSLNGVQLRSIPLLVPGDIRDQRRVAAALGDADDLIASLRQLTDKKLAIKQGMMQQLLTGRTRLPAFTDTWDWRPFSRVMQRVKARKYQIPASFYRDFGRLPVVDQGQRAVIGYTDEMSAEFDPGEDGVIVFGDHTCITKFVNFPFAVGADGTQILKALPNMSTRFFAYRLEVDPVASTGYNRHFKQLREKYFPVPGFGEQMAIARVLADVDHEIGALRRRHAKACELKQGMMQQLLTGRTRFSAKEVAGEQRWAG